MANEITVNLIPFNADLKKFADQIQVDIVTVTKKVAIEIFTKVTERTPVDTGRARANWNISLGSPDLSTTPPGTHAEFQGDPTGAATQKAQAVLGGMQQPEVIWIANGLPYIARLNDGYSQQSPAAFVETAIAEVEAEIDSLLL